MRSVFKFLLPVFIFIFFIFFYFRYTESGQKNAYTILGFYVSHKAGLNVKVKEMNFNQFPYIKAKILVENEYQVDIDGFVKQKHLDLRYTLHSECFKSNICTFDDIINIEGKIKGWRNDINVTGYGEGIGGTIEYSFLKQKRRFHDINLHLNDVNSSKLATLLDQKIIFKGTSTAHIYFDYIEKEHMLGTIIHDIKDESFHDINTSIHTQIDIHDDNHTFSLDITSPDMLLHLTKGTYNKNIKQGQANYTLDIKDLSKLEDLLRGKYVGEFHLNGKMIYDNTIRIEGVSTDLGGELHMVYDNKMLELELHNISFQSLMQTLATKPFLSAKTIGKMTFDTQNKKMYSKLRLKQAKLLPSGLIRTIHKKFDLNLIDEVFDKSTLELSYDDENISSNLKLANDRMHLFLKDTKFNRSNNAIDTHIDLRTPKHTAKGKLYVRIDTIGEKSLDDIYLKYDGLIERNYQIKLDGLLSDAYINMDYKINAARLPSHICTIVDDINLTGHVSGSYKRLHIVGNGQAMEGKVNFSAIKRKDTLENVSFNLKNIHALKLFTLLGQPTLPDGKADIQANFSTLSEKKKKGTLSYALKKGRYEKLPLMLNANFKIDNTFITFNSHALLSTAEINITKGQYNLDTNISKAFYTIKTKDLTPMEPMIGKYRGPFSALGEIKYNKEFKIRGLTRSYGGMIDFLYKQEMLYIDLEKISLKRFMNIFPYPHMLDAEVKGNINYDYKRAKLLVRADLNNTKFLSSDLVQTVFKKSGVNMLKEVFSNSTLEATYQNKILFGSVILKNRQSHFYLTNAKIDANNNTVNAYFDLKMQGQEFSGKVYGSLDTPKVNLNMQKLIRYQMDKQLDTYMGKGNRKMMESMPMGDVAKDVASEFGAGFMGIFF